MWRPRVSEQDVAAAAAAGRGSFPEAEHGVDVPEQVPHLVHQRLHLLVLLAHFLGGAGVTHTRLA